MRSVPLRRAMRYRPVAFRGTVLPRFLGYSVVSNGGMELYHTSVEKAMVSKNNTSKIPFIQNIYRSQTIFV